MGGSSEIKGSPTPESPNALSTAALVGGLVAAIATQRLVMEGLSGGAALAAFGGSVALFVGGLLGADSPRGMATGLLTCPSRRPGAHTSAATGSTLGIRPLPALLALALGVITFVACGGNRFTPFNVTTWLLSMALGVAACWQGDVSSTWSLVSSPGRWLVRLIAPAGAGEATSLRLSGTGVALAAISLASLSLLLYRIADVPAEMTSDHAEKLLDAQDVLDGQYRIFFPRNTGREALQFYLIAAMAPLTGLSYLTMKLGTVLVAACTLPFTFLLTRLLFGTGLALLATAILGSTRWLWQVARVGLRFPFPPAFGAAIFYFLVKAIRDRRRNDFLLCGLALGLAQHTYTALRLAPVAVLACLGVALAADMWRREPAGRIRRLVLDTALLGVMALLGCMPLARYAVEEPQSFLYRGVTRLSSDAQNAIPRDLLGVFLDNVKNALLMFNWRGDVVWVNTIPGERMLDPISGALFLLGCAYGLYRLLRYRELPYLYLFVLLGGALLPSMLSLAYPGENPSTVRSGMAIPVVAMLVALPVMLLARRLALLAAAGGPALGVAAERERFWERRPGQGTLHVQQAVLSRTVAVATVAVLLVPIVRINVYQYFSIYARQHSQASQHTTQVARVVNGFLALGGRREDVYILPWAHWFDSRLVAIQTGDIRWQPLIPSVDDARKADGLPRQRLYVVHPDDQAALDRLAHWYPTAVRHVHALADTGGQPYFVTVLLPPGATSAP